MTMTTAYLLLAAIALLLPVSPAVVAGTSHAVNHYLDPAQHPRIKAYLTDKDNDR